MSTIATSPPWFSVPRRNPDAFLRLYCLPYAGGASAVFRPWVAAAPPGIELRLVELPGRGARFGEAPLGTIESMADAVSEAIARDAPGPYALFGHSMGGSVAYEIALRRERAGAAPRALIISATPAPHVPDREAPVSHLPRASLIAKMRELGGTPAEVLEHDELLDLMLPLVRADFAACERYDTRTRPPVVSPLFAYSGARDERVTEADARAWEQYTRGRFRARVFPGDHFFLHSDRAALLQALAEDLASV